MSYVAEAYLLFLIWRGKRSSTYLTGEYVLHRANKYIFVDEVSTTAFSGI